MSVFVAFELSSSVRESVSALIAAHASIPAKWQRVEKLHVTLVFLGNPTADQVEAFKPVIDRVAAEHVGFSLHLESAGLFETMRAPAVLWLGVAGQLDALRGLQASLSEALEVTSTQAYVPHLTLARAQDAKAFDQALPTLKTVRAEAFRVSDITLFESTHHQYRPLHTAHLRVQSPTP